MIRFWDIPEACVETEAEADRYAETLPNRITKICFWMWWACQWMVLGYDQNQRWDIRVGGECDCSSLAYWCLWKAGYLARPVGNLYDYLLYTGTLREHLVAAGWAVMPVDGNPGDGWVLLNDGHHVAICIGNGLLGQASIDENGNATGGQSGDQTGYETNVREIYNYPWSCYLCPPPDPEPEPQRKTPRPTGNEDGGVAGPVFRLYNPYVWEHFFTTSSDERDVLCSQGWKFEGVAFEVGDTGDRVYRLLDPLSGQHLFTLGLAEAQMLWDLGWEFEGIAWRAGGPDPVWRLYNPAGGQHQLTASNAEHADLVDGGWRQEGVAFRAKSV